jgi:hypothetical protein
MIANERQFRIAGAQLRRFEEALAARAASEPGGDIASRIFEAMADAIASGAELRSRDPIRHSLAITRKRGRRMDVEHHPAERRFPQNP